MKVKIMRGVPGSGKSTKAVELATEFHNNNPNQHNIPRIVSADHFFITADGTYKYDKTKLSEAHEECMRKFMRYLYQDTYPFVVVDNTNLTAVEMAPYVSVARALGYEVEIIQVMCDADVAAARNVHGVPISKVKEMQARLIRNPIPKFWDVKVTVHNAV